MKTKKKKNDSKLWTTVSKPKPVLFQWIKVECYASPALAIDIVHEIVTILVDSDGNWMTDEIDISDITHFGPLSDFLLGVPKAP